ncbi:hypothetical protein P6U16_06305 [Rhizobium sp. 32-5/1]|uniref:hypothetical protein n=1 Tax=Rhizobium sp. 32-5/1 TaxID=3019602 RepID=UPI00240D5ECB|nr:hypothetical protein [Rhizobium sp. 32-5/1]WEZ84268.1 hypothetical protein P6U16_06305 [Rhizobium sp. 32-5/1]
MLHYKEEGGRVISTQDAHWNTDFSALGFMMPGYAAIQAEETRAHEHWTQALVQGRHLMESWTCDLSTGLFAIGDKARARHGLGPNARGLLDLVRSYAREDRQTVLNVLEEATARSSSFCYCTTIVLGDGPASRVFCVGSSEIIGGRGRLQGIYAFPPLNG